MKYSIIDSEAGNIIDTFATEAEAQHTIKEYEASDMKEGIYSKNFYSIKIN